MRRRRRLEEPGPGLPLPPHALADDAEAMPEELADDIVEEAAREEEVAEEERVAREERALADERANRASAERVADALRHPAALNFNWGPFAFTAKVLRRRGRQRGSSGAAAAQPLDLLGTTLAWQCRCPFHRKSQATGCKKTLTVQASTASAWEAQSDLVQRALKLWASRAPEYELQVHHVAWDPDLSSAPPDELLAASCIAEGPTERPRTDEEILAGPAPAEPAGAEESPGSASSSSSSSSASASGPSDSD